MCRIGCESFLVIIVDIQYIRVMEEGETSQRQGFHPGVLIFVIVRREIPFKLDPQQTLHPSCGIRNNKVMLLHMGDAVQRKMGTSCVCEMRFDLNSNARQTLGKKKIVQNRARLKFH